ncbi:MAG: hypothetical protein JRG68_03390 [Deltaproteobacteria bacterium]|nr:hypothetical protein [Deltaproteobacteria bacterium]MBW2099801.1 hypothetical protein [Deltaproteobacteria bacterium]
MKLSLCANAQNLYAGVKTLSHDLIRLSEGKNVGKIAVTDFIGPGNDICALGEHISDKLTTSLFASGAFPEVMERKQLKELISARIIETSGHFDSQTVPLFGEMIGADSLVIGSIEDMGSFLDVTAKMIESATGRLQSMADVRIIKDNAAEKLLALQRTADISFQINPPDATLCVGGENVPLTPAGFARLKKMPVGEQAYSVRAKGYKDEMGTFNPAKKRLVTVDLATDDPFYAVKNKFFKKVQQMGPAKEFSVNLWTNRKTYRLGDSISAGKLL